MNINTIRVFDIKWYDVIKIEASVIPMLVSATRSLHMYNGLM